MYNYLVMKHLCKWVIVLTIFLSACEADQPVIQTQVPSPATVIPVLTPTLSEEMTVVEIPAVAAEAIAPCPGEEINKIGQAIVEDFEDVEYDEVMYWFCEGASFEDILVALETETVSGTLAEDMLLMLVDGYTWDEIWFLVEIE